MSGHVVALAVLAVAAAANVVLLPMIIRDARARIRLALDPADPLGPMPFNVIDAGAMLNRPFREHETTPERVTLRRLDADLDNYLRRSDAT